MNRPAIDRAADDRGAAPTAGDPGVAPTARDPGVAPTAGRGAATAATGPGSEVAAARARLAQAQAELLGALVAGGPTPAGFDRARLRVQADALVAKRREVVARLRPDLVAAAGEQFRRLFDGYARRYPRPPAGARADAEAFGRTFRIERPSIQPTNAAAILFRRLRLARLYRSSAGPDPTGQGATAG